MKAETIFAVLQQKQRQLVMEPQKLGFTSHAIPTSGDYLGPCIEACARLVKEVGEDRLVVVIGTSSHYEGEPPAGVDVLPPEAAAMRATHLRPRNNVNRERAASCCGFWLAL